MVCPTEAPCPVSDQERLRWRRHYRREHKEDYICSTLSDSLQSPNNVLGIEDGTEKIRNDFSLMHRKDSSSHLLCSLKSHARPLPDFSVGTHPCPGFLVSATMLSQGRTV